MSRSGNLVERERRGPRATTAAVAVANAVLATAVLVTAPAFAAGFGIFEQGTKAMGMAGAFTAQADDGSAMFHNVAGIAFIDETLLQAGLTLITPEKSEFEGANPFPGVGVRAEQEDLLFYPPHLYYVKPLNDRVRFGFAVNAPFGLETEWKDRDTFPGRFISARAKLETLDLNPGFAIKLCDTASVGLGVVLRNARVGLSRNVPLINPFTFTPIDVAEVELESDFERGWGFTAGFLHKPSSRFSWGVSYRSRVQVDFGGDAEFTQIPTGNAGLDALVRTQIPFDAEIPVRTAVEMPDMASVGFAFGITSGFLVEVDANWTGWSSFGEIDLTFPENPRFSQTIPEDYEDVWNYRLGLRLDVGSGQLRFGYVYDESPQPDETVGPLLPDANRDGITIGYGLGKRFDLALMYLTFDERTTLVNRDHFFGTYNTTVWLLGATVTF